MSANARALRGWDLALAAMLAAVLAYGFFVVPGFWSTSNASLAIQTAMPVALIALALALVLLIAQIDISVASMLGLASAVLGELVLSGTPLAAAIPVVIACGLLAGALNGALVAYAALPSLVVTLGTLALFRGACYILLGDEQVSSWPAWFTDLGSGTVGGTQVPWSSLVFLAALVVLGCVLGATWIGRTLRAIGLNAEVARFSGIDVRRLTFAMFVLSGALAALAGILETARLSSASPANGTGLELEAIAIVLLGGISIFGGRGTLLGVVLALTLITALKNILGLQGVNGDVQNVVVGALLITSVLAGNALVAIRSSHAARRRTRGATPPTPEHPPERKSTCPEIS